MPRARRPRHTKHSSVNRPDQPEQVTSLPSVDHPDPLEQIASLSLVHLQEPPEQIASPSSVHHLDSQEMMASPSPTPEFSSTEIGSSSSSNPGARPLPLDWTTDQCLTLSKYMFENRNDFDDSAEWWGKIVPYLPGKTVQELRLFSYRYIQDFSEMLPDPTKIQDSDMKVVTQSERDTWEALNWKISSMVQNPEKLSLQNTLPTPEGLVQLKPFEWTLEESRKLLDLIKRNPSILSSKLGWTQLVSHFPEKKGTSVMQHLAMVKFVMIFSKSANPNPDWQCLTFYYGHDAEENTGDQQPSTSADSQKASDDTEVWHRGPLDDSSTDSAPSTSGSPFSSSKPSSSRSGRGGSRSTKIIKK